MAAPTEHPHGEAEIQQLIKKMASDHQPSHTLRDIEASDRERGIVRPDLVYRDVVYNFAIGANIYPPFSLKSSRGFEEGIHYVSFELAWVQGYRLAFDLACVPPFEPSFASLRNVQDQHSASTTRDALWNYDVQVDGCVYGALIEMTGLEYNKLFVTEGGRHTDPPYTEIVVDCRTSSGRVVQAVAFSVTPHRRAPGDWDVPPSSRYLEKIIKGAVALQVPEAYLMKLRRVKSVRAYAGEVATLCYRALMFGYFQIESSPLARRGSFWRSCVTFGFYVGLPALAVRQALDEVCLKLGPDTHTPVKRFVKAVSDVSSLCLTVPVITWFQTIKLGMRAANRLRFHVVL
ncbi:hypothetical protein FVE85_8374 [Porphyridium purpureum]|uniref:Uncharacterized protein n=1 Tax=Porphyridium purpureum TaxID=35688 RepID=A0A5J4YLM5_PORPP|nr:hypothetical protein FVE85_8374 [Porphyridium purpureum]|eukprot:POR0288..scf244_11